MRRQRPRRPPEPRLEQGLAETRRSCDDRRLPGEGPLQHLQSARRAVIRRQPSDYGLAVANLDDDRNLNQDQSQLEEDLSFEIIKSERIRALALMCILGGLFLWSIILGFALPRSWNPIRQLVGDKFPFAAAAIFYGLAFVYELGVHTVLGKAIDKRFRVPDFPRYGNALAETSMPTIMLVLLANALGPEIALNSPLPMVYFLFIVLSTLRLGAPLSIFTGCVAGVEFAALAFYYLPSLPGPRTFFTSP